MMCTSRSAGTSRLILFKNAMKSFWLWLGRIAEITVPEAVFSAANKSTVPSRS
jgi:hypothetical protein